MKTLAYGEGSMKRVPLALTLPLKYALGGMFKPPAVQVVGEGGTFFIYPAVHELMLLKPLHEFNAERHPMNLTIIIDGTQSCQ